MRQGLFNNKVGLIAGPSSWAGRTIEHSCSHARSCVNAAEPALRRADSPVLNWDQLLLDLPAKVSLLRAGQAIYRAGERLTDLHLIQAGTFKVVNLTTDGREHLVAIQSKNEWLGLEGIASGHQVGDAISMDVGVVRSVQYQVLMRACAERPPLLAAFLASMGQDLVRSRNWAIALNGHSALARVAEFLIWWVDGETRRGMRNSEVTLPVSRSEIGSLLGLRLESVSRAISRLVQVKLISIPGPSRRELCVLDMSGLTAIAQSEAQWDGRNSSASRTLPTLPTRSITGASLSKPALACLGLLRPLRSIR